MKWTNELDEQLRVLSRNNTYESIAKILGTTKQSVKQRGRKIGINKCRTLQFTQEQQQYITTNFADLPTKQIAEKLGVGIHLVRRFAYKHGLKKSQAFNASPLSGRIVKGSTKGQATRFKTGGIPFTKGKKQFEFMSLEAIERTKATRFKKGNLPINTKLNGTVSIRANGHGRQLKWIRVSQNKWALLNRFTYEKNFGAIPPGMMVAFKDNNPLNCEVENLFLESVQDHMARNTIARFDPELREVIRLLSKVKRKIKQHEKQD